MKTRKYEGLMSEEMEMFCDMINSMTYEQTIEYAKQHPEILNAKISIEDLPYIEDVDAFIKKYNLVDMTSFFVSHGYKRANK